MSEMEDQLGAILGNPQMMEKIKSLAQSLGQSEAPPQGKPITSSAEMRGSFPPAGGEKEEILPSCGDFSL